jgi:hypothetical protein
MTVHKCQAVVAAGSWRNPKVKLMAVIVPPLFQSPAFYVRAVQNVMVPLVSFHDGGSDDDDESD